MPPPPSGLPFNAQPQLIDVSNVSKKFRRVDDAMAELNIKIISVSTKGIFSQL